MVINPEQVQCLIKVELSFQVVKSSNKPWSSAEACEQLGLLKVEIDLVESIHVLERGNLTEQYILSHYKDVFEGLGHIGSTSISESSTI